MKRYPSRRHSRGLTLIELMVSLLIGMLLSLAVFEVMATFEGRRRTLTSVNDIEQAGHLALYKIDKWVRGAGAGLPQAAGFLYGCPVYAAKANAQVLPRSTPIDAPFADVDPGTDGTFRAAPLLILPGQTTPGASGRASDVLVLMAGFGDSGTTVPFAESGTASGSALSLINTVDFAAGDMVLVADRQAAGDGSRRPCMVEQVSSGFAAAAGNTLALSGDYHAATIGGTSLSGYSSSAVAIDLGNPSGRAPSFMLVGVGDNDVLYSYDLLQASGTPLQAQAEGVFELHALYGVDADGDGKVDAWVSPATGNYSLAALSAGNATAASRLAQIKAVRIGLILRTSLAEKTAVTTSALALFSDLGDLAYSRALAGDEQHYRYRTMETIVPVRNNLLVSP